MRLRRPARRSVRSRAFRAREQGRYWWHHLDSTDYVPAIYDMLDQWEWELLDAWYAETERRGMVGEINVPAMSVVLGLVDGGAATRFVQLGHYCGYSTLLLGFWLRRMGGERRLVTVDVDPVATEFAQEWVRRVGLDDVVTLLTGDAGDAALRDRVVELAGGPPEIVLLDTSHGYEATQRELDAWLPAVVEQGLLLVHGVSAFAARFDPTHGGGVGRALDDWAAGRDDVAYLSLNRAVAEGADANRLVYKDGTGLAILQRLPGAKPVASTPSEW